jgi:DNA-binding GntR family transcriptional regulator
LISVNEPPVINTSGPELIYVQVANHVANRIKSGEFPPGSRLPPERELAVYYEVAYDTIRRAMMELRKREMIVTVHGRGTYVNQRLHG